MGKTVIVESISRSDTFPIVAQVSAENNKGYITVNTKKFTPQMFYELPALKFEIYTEFQGRMVKYKNFCKVVRTYNPIFEDDSAMIGTMDIKNIPNNFYLYLTPIFDNNAIGARNELILNGIESGDLWNTITNTFDILIEFNEYNDGQAGQDVTISGIPPLQIIDNYGDYLVDYKIYGNAVQNGTPTPDAPVSVDGCGDRTENLFDAQNGEFLRAYIRSTDGWVGSSGFAFTAIIPCAPNTTYTSTNPLGNRHTIGCFSSYPAVKDTATTYISDATSDTLTITTGADTKYIGLFFYDSTGGGIPPLEDVKSEIMFNTVNTAKPYEPYGYKVPVSCAGTTTPIYLGQAQTLRKIKKLVLTGGVDESWQANGIGTDKAFFYMTISDNAESNLLCVSTHFQAKNIWSSTTVIGVSIEGRNVMRLRPDNASTVFLSDFKQWLSTQYQNGTPVTVWYVLANEQTGIVNEPLMKIGDYADSITMEQTAVQIPMVHGNNTLSIETTVQPSNVSITYTQQIH